MSYGSRAVLSSSGEAISVTAARFRRPARIIVCGGRDYTNMARVVEVLDALRAERGVGYVFHGNARGADGCADVWAKRRGVPVLAVPARWSKYGKRAGPIRNQAMLGHGIDLVVAFPGGTGTADMVKRARTAGVEVHEVDAAEVTPSTALPEHSRTAREPK